MRVYVLGAGVSKTVGYPLGAELFEEVSKFIRQSGSARDRFEYKHWKRLRRRLRENKNSLIAEAYQRRQIEHLFTVLDLASILRSDSHDNVFRSLKHGPKARDEAMEVYKRFNKVTRNYREYREILLWALEAYFEHMHFYDSLNNSRQEWDSLRLFARKLEHGDVVITFNYDSTVERVLIQEGKWSPKHGYGSEVVFQQSPLDEQSVEFETSPITTYHLHGALGWYRKPATRTDYVLPSAGAIPREALTPAPIETKIALDPIFLRDLGLRAIDASLPERPPAERQVLLHPSFFKDFELEGGSSIFTELWRKAADVLRAADEIVIIGYSLPRADSASLTLLLTNCERGKVHIVNSNVASNWRLKQLLATNKFGPPQSFEDWLTHGPR